MVKLKSKTLRGGVVIVGSAKYQVSAEGCVEVPEDAARRLSQGADWAVVAGSSAPAKPDAPKATPPKAPAPALEPVAASAGAKLEDLTKDQLRQMAKDLGLEVDPKLSKLKLMQAVRAVKRG